MRWWLGALPLSLADICQKFLLSITRGGQFPRLYQWFICTIIATCPRNLCLIRLVYDLNRHCLSVKGLKLCWKSILVRRPRVLRIVLEAGHPASRLYLIVHKTLVLTAGELIGSGSFEGGSCGDLIMIDSPVLLLQSRLDYVLHWYALFSPKPTISVGSFTCHLQVAIYHLPSLHSSHWIDIGCADVAPWWLATAIVTENLVYIDGGVAYATHLTAHDSLEILLFNHTHRICVHYLSMARSLGNTSLSILASTETTACGSHLLQLHSLCWYGCGQLTACLGGPHMVVGVVTHQFYWTLCCCPALPTLRWLHLNGVVHDNLFL